MTELRMGLKHTDFSIKRILSKDDRSPSRKDNGDILDLSKTGSVREYSSFPRQIYPSECGFAKYGYHLMNSFYYPQYSNYGGIMALPSSVLSGAMAGTSGGRGEVIRPRVCKAYNPARVEGFNNCERFYGNFNCPKYVGYKDAVSSMWVGAAAATQFVKSQEIVENMMVNSVTVNMSAQVGVSGVVKGGTVKAGKDMEDDCSFKCGICDKVFGCADTLQSHEKTHKSPRYECAECGKGFSQLRNYKYHLSVHRGTKEFAAECPECGKTFNDKGYLSSHMKIHRNKKEYECPYCIKSFNQRVAFNMHVRIHTGVKPHKCNECGKRFSRKMLLKQHLRTHSGEKPYQCSVCGKSFADRSNMTLHHRLHSGIKPFNCPICPKAFTKKHHLKTHLNYHTGCKPYVCPHPNCNQAFTQSSNMRTHAKKCQFKPVQYPAGIATQLPPAMPAVVTSRSIPLTPLPYQC